MNIRDVAKRFFLNPRNFLLENLGVKQTIFKNTLWLATADGINRLLKLFLFIYIARILGATEYGKFTFALAFVGLFVIFSDLGLSQIIIREFSRDKEKEKEISSLFSLKILLSLGTIFLILISSFFVTPDRLIQKLIWILGAFIIIEYFSIIIFAFFQARQKMEYQAWTKTLEAIIVVGVGFFILFYFPSVLNLSYSYLLAGFSALVFILLLFHYKVFPIKLTFQKTIWKEYLKMSWPLALASMFGSIYNNTDSAMMGYFGQITQTGWYNAAYRIIGVTLVPAGLFGISFFPALSLALKESTERLQKIWNYFLESMVFLAIPILVGGIVLASKIIDLVFDPSYFPSILAFQILILMAGINILAYPFSQILVVFNQQKKLFWITLSGAIVNIILNLILIPEYSLYGAAIATVITVFLVLSLLLRFTLKFTSIKPLNFNFLLSFINAVISSMVMYFLISKLPIYNLHVFISILIGALVYSVTFFALRMFVKRFM